MKKEIREVYAMFPPCYQNAIVRGGDETPIVDILKEIVTYLQKKVKKDIVVSFLFYWNDKRYGIPNDDILNIVNSVWKEYNKKHTCEYLKSHYVEFALGCNIACPIRRKEFVEEKRKEELGEITDFIYDSVDTLVIHPGNDTYFDFQIGEDTIQMNSKEILSVKMFATKYVGLFYDAVKANEIRRIGDEIWAECFNRIKEDKGKIIEKDGVTNDGYIIEVVTNKISRLGVYNRIEMAVEGSGGIFYNEKEGEYWIATRIVTNILDREKIRIDVRRMSYLMGDYKLSSKIHRYGKVTYRGWVLNNKKFNFDFSSESDDEPLDENSEVDKGNEKLDFGLGTSPKEKFRIVENILRDYFRDSKNKSISKIDVELQAQLKGIERNEVGDVIKELKNKSIIYELEEGVYEWVP